MACLCLLTLLSERPAPWFPRRPLQHFFFLFCSLFQLVRDCTPKTWWCKGHLLYTRDRKLVISWEKLSKLNVAFGVRRVVQIFSLFPFFSYVFLWYFICISPLIFVDLFLLLCLRGTFHGLLIYLIVFLCSHFHYSLFLMYTIPRVNCSLFSSLTLLPFSLDFRCAWLLFPKCEKHGRFPLVFSTCHCET